MHAAQERQENRLSELRREVEFYCQALVNSGMARWWIRDTGEAELRMHSGEWYLLGELGVTRLR